MGKWLVIGSEWIYRVVKANLSWVALVLLGGGILGFFPATIALARLVNRWLQGEKKVPIWQTMWREYRLNFKLGSQFALLYNGSLVVILVNLRLAFQIHHLYFMMIAYMLLFLLVVWLVSLTYLFPLVANFEGSCLVYLKQAIAVALKDLRILGLQVVGLFLIWLLNLEFSSLIIFGTAVIWQFYTAYCCRKVLAKITKEQALCH